MVRIPPTTGDDLSNIVCLVIGLGYLNKKYPVGGDIFKKDKLSMTILWGLGSGIFLALLNATKVYIVGGMDVKYCREIIGLVDKRVFLYSFFISSALIIPILEEMLFRGYYYRILRNRYNSVILAMAITCALSALAHFSLSSAVSSIAFTYVYEKNNVLGAPIIAHIILNLSWYCLVYNHCLAS
jgi:membrane protease YdiL (CAAX protease family)